MPTCAIYARVSDEMQAKGESVAHQVSFLREFVRRKSQYGEEVWLTPDELIYCDEGVTGTSIVKRGAVRALLCDAQAGKFSVVLFKGISRFARDTVDALVMLRTLQAYGLRVISFEENFDSEKESAELIFTMHSAVAQYESEKIGIRVRVGNFEKARSGKWTGRVPDGYRLDPATKRLQLDPLRKWVIERIFLYAAEKKGIWRVAARLNEEGVRTRQGGRFTAQKVKRILQNPVYVGDVVYGRRIRRLLPPGADDPLARRYKVVWNPDVETVAACANAHPALISRELFAKVQTFAASAAARRGRIGNPRLLKGLLFCSCGKPMNVKQSGGGVPYYRCQARAKGGAECRQPYLRAEEAEALVQGQLRKDMLETMAKRQIQYPQHLLEQITDSPVAFSHLVKRVQVTGGAEAAHELLIVYKWR